MSYYLILLIASYGTGRGPALTVTNMEFFTEYKCEQAAEKIKSSFQKLSVQTACVEKTTKQVLKEENK